MTAFDYSEPALTQRHITPRHPHCVLARPDGLASKGLLGGACEPLQAKQPVSSKRAAKAISKREQRGQGAADDLSVSYQRGTCRCRQSEKRSPVLDLQCIHGCGAPDLTSLGPIDQGQRDVPIVRYHL